MIGVVVIGCGGGAGGGGTGAGATRVINGVVLSMGVTTDTSGFLCATDVCVARIPDW